MFFFIYYLFSTTFLKNKNGLNLTSTNTWIHITHYLPNKTEDKMIAVIRDIAAIATAPLYVRCNFFQDFVSVTVKLF